MGTTLSGMVRPSPGFHSSCDNRVVPKLPGCLSGAGASYRESVIFAAEQAYPAYLVLFGGKAT